MIIGIDHGNSHIKTVNHCFRSGIDISDSKPPLASCTMEYAGKYHSLTDGRLNYQWDKAMRPEFFSLTLIAIAKELDSRGIYMSGQPEPIILAVGLPPEFYRSQNERFREYFKGHQENLHFFVDGKEYLIRIVDVEVYPQAYSAAFANLGIIREGTFYVFDLGGITFDWVRTLNGKPDLSTIGSLEMGLITLYKKIQSRVVGNHGVRLDDTDLDSIFRGHPGVILSPEVSATISQCASEHIPEILGELRERGLDTRVNTAVWVGGGAQALRQQIQNCPIGRNLIIEDVKANAKGFELLSTAARRRG